MAVWDTQEAQLTDIAIKAGIKIPLGPVGTVALFPVRYAIGDDGSATTAVAAPFKVADATVEGRSAKNLAPTGGKLHYTLRCLRRGYLYVYTEKKVADPGTGEKRKSWALFEITKDVPLKAIALLTPEDKALDIANRNKVLAMGDNAPIEDRQNITPLLSAAVSCTGTGLLLLNDDVDVWVCHSDTIWTARTLRKAQREAEFRNRHMRQFDPAGCSNDWAGVKHTVALGEKGTRAVAVDQTPCPAVSELQPRISPEAFWFSQEPFRWYERKDAYEYQGKKYNNVKQLLEALPYQDAIQITAKIEAAQPSSYGDFGKPKLALDQVSLEDPEVLKAFNIKKVKQNPMRMTLKQLKALPTESSDGRKVPGAKDVKGWAVLALEDPVGIAKDLSSLTQARYKAWECLPDPYPYAMKWGKEYEGKPTGWFYHGSQGVSLIKEAVESTFNQEETKYAVNWKPDQYWNTEERKKEYAERTSPEGRKKRWDDLWKRYNGKYTEAIEKSWFEDFKPRLEDFDSKVLLHIVQLFVMWMDSGRMKAYFDGVFDDANAASGAAFRETLDRCYEGMEDRPLVMKHINEYLNRSMDKGNLVGRSIVFNQKSLWEQIQKFSKGVLTSSLLKSCISTFNKDLGNYINGQPSIVMRMLQRCMGPLSASMLKRPGGFPVLDALCVGSGKARVTYEVSGTPEELFDQITDHLSQGAMKGSPEWEELHRQLTQRKEELFEKGLLREVEDVAKKKINVSYLGLINPDDLDKLPSDPTARNKYLADLMASDKFAKQIEFNKAVTGGTFAFVLGVMSYANMVNTLRALDSVMANEKSEKLLRLAFAIPALAVSTVDWVGKMMILCGNLGSRKGAGLVTATGEGFVKWAAKPAAILGLITAGIDIFQGVTEVYCRKKVALGLLYIITAVVGGISTYGILTAAAWAVAGPFSLVTAFISLALGIAISNLANDKMQNWLERCCWGAIRDERYKSWGTQIHELELAIGKK